MRWPISRLSRRTWAGWALQKASLSSLVIFDDDPGEELRLPDERELAALGGRATPCSLLGAFWDTRGFFGI